MEYTCYICLEDLKDNDICLCDHEEHRVHSACIVNHIEWTIESAFLGSCPIIACPLFHEKGGKLLNYDIWKDLVNPKILWKYGQLANSLLSILCGGCHSIRNIGVEFNDKKYSGAASFIDVHLKGKKLSDFNDLLNDFKSGNATTDLFYNSITTIYFPQLLKLNDRECWSFFKNIVALISSPERRANLHLRYLRDRPRIWTSCCDRDHCFRCKTKDYHSGKSCEENTDLFDSSIVQCPSCNIFLTKGDGCNSVTCVCGKQFSWSIEKEISERSLSFSRCYPIDTGRISSLILMRKIDGDQDLARSWRVRNISASNLSFLKLWKEEYPICPSQCCSIFQNKKTTEGRRIAIDVWSSVHAAEVNFCTAQNKIANELIFNAIFNDDHEKYLATRKLLTDNSGRGLFADPLIYQSAVHWMENNKEIFEKHYLLWEISSAKQFFFLFGTKTIFSTHPSRSNFFSPLEWNTSISNSALVFSNFNKTVCRPGSASCYPAALMHINNPQSCINILLEEAPRSPNWLTFGLVRNNIPISSSDGVGRSLNSWGICDDRGSTGGSYSLVVSCGQTVGQCRKLTEGDILHGIVDITEGWFEIHLNDELVHKFDIPTDNFTDYLFAMTFANDHKATIVHSVDKTTTPTGTLNSDHSEMYQSVKRIARKLISGCDFSSIDDMHLFQRYSENWENLCGSKSECLDKMRLFDPIVDTVLQKSNTSGDAGDSRNYPISPTWDNVFSSICWRYLNKEEIEREESLSLATTFLSDNKESAAFVAAALFSTNRLDPHCSEMKRAKAFMSIYKDEMNEWYCYNANLKEPLLGLEHVPKGCMCLPRHLHHCPRASVQDPGNH